MSSSDPCNCDDSKRPPISGGALSKLDLLRREATRSANEWERYGYVTEAAEWREAAKALEGIK